MYTRVGQRCTCNEGGRICTSVVGDWSCVEYDSCCVASSAGDMGQWIASTDHQSFRYNIATSSVVHVLSCMESTIVPNVGKVEPLQSGPSGIGSNAASTVPQTSTLQPFTPGDITTTTAVYSQGPAQGLTASCHTLMHPSLCVHKVVSREMAPLHFRWDMSWGEDRTRPYIHVYMYLFHVVTLRRNMRSGVSPIVAISALRVSHVTSIYLTTHQSSTQPQ